MQPNQQDPNTQPGVPQPPAPAPAPASAQPQPYQVPEYLGLEPVGDTKAPGSRKRLAVIIFLVLIVATSVAVALIYFQWSQGEPERRFYAAIDTMMAQRSVLRENTLTVNSKKYRSATSYTDFSNTAKLASRVDYILAVEDKDAQERELSGEVMTADGSVFARLKSIPKLNELERLTTNKWYQVASDTPTGIADMLSMRGVVEPISSPYGEIILGNFTDAQRGLILELIKSTEVYRIVDSKFDNSNDGEYTIEYDTQKIGKLNKKVAELVGQKEAPQQYESAAKQKAITKRMTIKINAASEKVIQIVKKQTKDDSKVTVVDTTNFSYPAVQSIEKPADAVVVGSR